MAAEEGISQPGGPRERRRRNQSAGAAGDAWRGIVLRAWDRQGAGVNWDRIPPEPMSPDPLSGWWHLGGIGLREGRWSRRGRTQEARIDGQEELMDPQAGRPTVFNRVPAPCPSTPRPPRADPSSASLRVLRGSSSSAFPRPPRPIPPPRPPVPPRLILRNPPSRGPPRLILLSVPPRPTAAAHASTRPRRDHHHANVPTPSSRPQALVITAPGINCDGGKLVEAFRLAGRGGVDPSLSRLSREPTIIPAGGKP